MLNPKLRFVQAETTSLRILSLIPGLIPGIEQVVLVHSQLNSNDISGYLMKKTSGEYITDTIRIEAGSSFFNDLTLTNQPYLWFQKDQVPFQIRSKDKVQLTIFSELKNNILLINYSISGTPWSDLFFIYFNENLSNFILDKVSEPFSAQHKNMVGYLLFHSIQTLFNLVGSQNQLTAAFDEQIKQVVKERDQVAENLENKLHHERQSILKLARYYLSQFATHHGTTATLTDSAIGKLKYFQGELFQLEGVIQAAMKFAAALSSDTSQSPLLIADYHLRFPDPASHNFPDKVIDGLPQRMIKTHLLLDRLEIAASGIKQRKDSLTSVNVGKEFPTPISAPAITDALRKHKKRIIQLFDQYPDKWTTIRHEFRPIRNLLDSSQTSEQLSA